MAKIISFGEYFEPKKKEELLNKIKEIESDYDVDIVCYQESKLLSAASQMLDARLRMKEAFKLIDEACKELGFEDEND